MIPDRDFVQAMTIERVETIGGHIVPKQIYAPCERERAEQTLAQRRDDMPELELWPCPSCLVCGAITYSAINRCHAHRGRTPCAIEGCTKSRKFEAGCWDVATWVCHIHWRQVCPPRSPLRRTYLRFYRTARKLGLKAGDRWPGNLETRYWRFFRAIVGRYHRGVTGFIDEAEINKLFGWDA